MITTATRTYSVEPLKPQTKASRVACTISGFARSTTRRELPVHRRVDVSYVLSGIVRRDPSTFRTMFSVCNPRNCTPQQCLTYAYTVCHIGYDEVIRNLLAVSRLERLKTDRSFRREIERLLLATEQTVFGTAGLMQYLTDYLLTCMKHFSTATIDNADMARLEGCYTRVSDMLNELVTLVGVHELSAE